MIKKKWRMKIREIEERKRALYNGSRARIKINQGNRGIDEERRSERKRKSQRREGEEKEKQRKKKSPNNLHITQ